MSRRDFVDGARAVLPLLPGFASFGLIVGVASRELGLTVLEITGMSALMFAGTAQLAAVELFAEQTPVWVIVVTALLINLRFSMFSAAIEPYIRSFSRVWKWLAGFLVTTPAFVLSSAEFDSDRERSREWYYLGTALPVYLNWVGSTTVGALVGTGVPPGLGLDFVVPLVFLALLFRMVDGHPTLAAAVGAGIVAIPATGLPLNLGLVAATVAGVLVGLALGGEPDGTGA
ncbi:MAG: AzlC family ABC transporter permease [Salinirussus sp.]